MKWDGDVTAVYAIAFIVTVHLNTHVKNTFLRFTEMSSVLDYERSNASIPLAVYT